MANRNAESHFASNPTNLDMSRSKFDLSHSVKTTFNVGEIIPFCPPIEVLPGDTFSIDTSKVIRLQTPLVPVMDNLYCDFYWFFVPNRLVWDHWKEFMGENSAGYWTPSTTYSVPMCQCTYSTGWPSGSIADYFGLPIGGQSVNMKVNALPFRAYALIMNEWFRSENLINPRVVTTGDTAVNYTSSNYNNYTTGCEAGGLPMRACKFFDYFTACLPAPQKGPDVLLPLGDAAPVVPKALTAYDPAPFSTTSQTTNFKYGTIGAGTSSSLKYDSSNVKLGGSSLSNFVAFTNLWADLSNATAATVNQLRLAFQIQKLYEKDARGGTRYIEILKSHFGVTSPDSRLQRPEYLGGSRIPININQVLSTADYDSGKPVGTTGAVSLTTDVHSDFTHSFTEHGFVIGLCVARYNHSYQQGRHKMWERENRLDYYWPVLANIGEQPVYTDQIYYDPANTSGGVRTVFGYNEAFAEYRTINDTVTGEMRSDAAASLDIWHFADDYASAPTLSGNWISEEKSNIDRCLAVPSSTSNQLFMDCFIKFYATRCMPVYSIPGLIDHH